MKNLLKVLFLSLCALSLFSCGQSQEFNDQKSLKSSVNTAQLPSAPDFELETLEGKKVSLKSLAGKFIVLHIATTWCPYCNAEAPHLEKIYQDYKDRNVEVLIIDVKESKELVQTKLQEKHKLTFPILLDHDGEVAGSFAPEDVLPDLARDEIMLASNLLIDPQGKIQFMSLLDTKNFDVELTELKHKLDEILLLPHNLTYILDREGTRYPVRKVRG